MNYEEIIAEQIAEGFIKDVTSGANVKYTGIKGLIKRFIDTRREVKHYREKKKLSISLSKYLDDIDKQLDVMEKRLEELDAENNIGESALPKEKNKELPGDLTGEKSSKESREKIIKAFESILPKNAAVQSAYKIIKAALNTPAWKN